MFNKIMNLKKNSYIKFKLNKTTLPGDCFCQLSVLFCCSLLG